MSAKVTIYKDANYRGTKKELEIGRYNIRSLGIGNDELSSLKVPAGLKATLYEHKNFSGRQVVCVRDTSYIGDGANDEISSIVIESLVTQNVILYTDDGYRGWSRELTPGRYPRQLAIGNDKLSSLIVPFGHRISLYEDVDYRSRWTACISDTASLGTFNDLTSAVIIEMITFAGEEFLQMALPHIGEPYIEGCNSVPKDNYWRGPWDCSEFVSWCVYQVSGILYGCQNDRGDSHYVNAQSGFWRDDSKRLGQRITIERAATIPGAVLLREPPKNEQGHGHVAFSDGEGGTVEAGNVGVTRRRIRGRTWHTGILIPGIQY